jgi:hypothetical protein
VVCALLLVAGAAPASAAQFENGTPIEIRRLAGPVEIDGDLSDPGWQGVRKIEEWYETNPGDNLPPKVSNVAWLAYDDSHLYAAFEFGETEAGSVRSPLGDRDNVPAYTDYGGVILDPRGDGKVAQMFLANARGIQYDAISSDASGEDSSPDFFWEAAGGITESGWRLEIRIPFASIRYVDPNPHHWGILLYRNRPREFRYQYFTSRLPRGRNCFVCSSRDLTGVANLPTGKHWVVAPFATAVQLAEPSGEIGSKLETRDADFEAGADLKWLPNPNTVIDATINPDFSQIESDTAQITANERFALFLPEKRPFFLESVDLLSTEIQAVYTRTFASPRWGGRATGGGEAYKYTVFVGEDRGGGSAILPGPESSELVTQDFESLVAVGRFRRDFGKAFASFLYSGREIDGGGSNRVFGPDFEWRPTEQDTITGQLLWSASETPDRPDLAEEWDGRKLEGHALELWWNRATATWDYFLFGGDVDEEFRADNGFVPQVGYRRGLGEIGRTFRPTDSAVSRLRLFTWTEYQEDEDGRALLREIVPGLGVDTLWNSFIRFEFSLSEIRSGDTMFERFQIRPIVDIRPGRVLSRIYLEGTFGDEVDFVHSRAGDGTLLLLQTDLRPTDHLQLALTYNLRRLDVDVPGRGSERLFDSEVSRLKAVYLFNARTWLRLIGQWVETNRAVELFTDEVERRDAFLAGSLVFAYKLNWQTVLYLGYADNRELDPHDDLQAAGRQGFFKISYAFRG